MQAKSILKHTKHRTFEVPSRSWKFYQEWNDAIFLHWKVSLKSIKPFLPKGIQLDTINGETWISLVAFNMNHIGIRSLPKLPHISDFHEINIRVYTICNEKPSVYFLNMEGSKRSSCKLLKTISKFPYQFSKMKRTGYSYESNNKKNNDSFYMEYRIGSDPIIKDETDIWLAERYAVHQEHKNKIIEYDVHHQEWPMQAITIKKLEIAYPKFNQLVNNKPDKVHYSKGVQVLTWDKKKLQL
ncbi:YqjF family protein [Bizionia sp.]|uniref:YqjF family protein n=1 Tax=Bizionia sp. TaxID=1954480 RepID=UPI003A94AEF6